MLPPLSRREFVTTAGAAGLTLVFSIPGGRGTAAAAAAAVFEPNAWLTITPDGAITVHIVRAEMGQGIGTALAQIVAEELEADWKDVRIDYPVNDPKFGPMFTAGSRSVKDWFDRLSRAGAAARLMLIDDDARHWAVDATDCIAERGAIRHPPTGRSISYGELVARVPITKTLTPEELKTIALKKPEQYRVVGKPIARLDIPEKVDGRATYGMDVFLPGMAYAKVAYPPTREGGKHRTVDDSAARQVKGHLQTIVTDDLVAVVAETYEAAVEARDALRIIWDLGPNANVDSASIFLDYERKARQETGLPLVSAGDAAAAMSRAVRTHTATYTTDFAAQAPMEPMNCVARWVDDRCEIFTGTQGQTLAAAVISRALGIPAAKVRIHQQLMGGSFGRRQDADAILEAATVSRAAGRSVKLIRSREEDFARGYYRTPTLQVMRAGLEATGRVTAWEHAVVAAFPAGRRGTLDPMGRDFTVMAGSEHAYEIPNQLVREIRGEHGISVGQYRSIGAGATSFAVESFVDELAHLIGTDPLAMRLAMLRQKPRLANVLKLAAAKAGWGAPLPPDVGRGLACTTFMDPKQPTWTAAIVQARVDRPSGEVRVEKITCAVDCGLVINPDGVRAQLEGGLLFGLSSALKEHGTVSHGAFDQKNFEDYPILRMDEVPEVEILVVESTEPPTGAGEPTTTVVTPALANAIFAATGARVRNLPFLPERVLKALKDKA
jgi:isoquinoline 1-oxidoreductase beta subunit